MKRLMTLLALCTVSALATPSALASEPGEGAEAGAPGDEIEVIDPATMKVDPSQVFWGQERRKIKIIEPRLFRKDVRHEFTLFLGLVPNDDFFIYMPVGLRWNYFFAEDFSVELWGLYDVTIASSLRNFLQEKTNQALLVEIPQTLVTMAGVDITWSPFHGKLAVINDGMATFDFHIAFGAGFIGTEVVDPATKVVTFKGDVSGNLGLGVRMHFTDMLSFRMDYRQYFYPAASQAGGGLAYPMEITLGVSLWTDAPQ